MKRRFALSVGLLFGLLVLGAGSAVASATEFDFHVGDQFLTNLGFPPGVVARAPNGDTIRVIGTGEFDTAGNEADGQGTFEHRSSSGGLIASGTWEATKLVSFTDFGGQAGLPPDLRGGSAVIKVHGKGHPATNPSATVEFDATLMVDCAIGNVPASFEEGITFKIDGGLNFNEKVSGVTVFVADE